MVSGVINWNCLSCVGQTPDLKDARIHSRLDHHRLIDLRYHRSLHHLHLFAIVHSPSKGGRTVGQISASDVAHYFSRYP